MRDGVVWLVEFKHSIGWTPVDGHYWTRRAAEARAKLGRVSLPTFKYRVVKYVREPYVQEVR